MLKDGRSLGSDLSEASRRLNHVYVLVKVGRYRVLECADPLDTVVGIGVVVELGIQDPIRF